MQTLGQYQLPRSSYCKTCNSRVNTSKSKRSVPRFVLIQHVSHQSASLVSFAKFANELV